jgi:hypothetical protein
MRRGPRGGGSHGRRSTDRDGAQPRGRCGTTVPLRSNGPLSGPTAPYEHTPSGPASCAVTRQLFQDRLRAAPGQRASQASRPFGLSLQLSSSWFRRHADMQGWRTGTSGGVCRRSFEGRTSCEAACRRERAHEDRAWPASHPGHGVREGDRDPDRLPRHRGRGSAPGRRGVEPSGRDAQPRAGRLAALESSRGSFDGAYERVNTRSRNRQAADRRTRHDRRARHRRVLRRADSETLQMTQQVAGPDPDKWTLSEWEFVANP